MSGGKGKIRPEDGKQFSKEYQPNNIIWNEEKSIEFFNELIEWFIAKNDNVFLNDFLYFEYMVNHKELKRTTFEDLPTYLKNKFTSCSKLYNIALKMQETRLIKLGIFNKLNAAMTKFILINNHGWKDKTEVEETGNVIINWNEEIMPPNNELSTG